MKYLQYHWSDLSKHLPLFDKRWVYRLVSELVVIGVLFYWVSTIGALGRYPGGDGPHIIGTSGRLAQLLMDGEFEWFVYCFSSLLG